MAGGYRGLVAPWVGGASAGPPPDFRGGYFSLLAPWLGGVGKKRPRAGYRSMVAPWLGGATARAAVIPPQPPIVIGPGGRPFRRIPVPFHRREDEDETLLAILTAAFQCGLFDSE